MLSVGLRVKTFKHHKTLAELKALKKALQTPPQPPPMVAGAQSTQKPTLRFGLHSKSTLNAVLDPNDKALFHQAVRGTTPLKTKNTGQKLPILPKKNTVPSEQYLQRQRHANGEDELLDIYGLSDEFALEFYDRPINEYRSSYCGTDVLRDLKKGRWPIANHIDLHGSTLEQARLRLNYFLKHSLIEQYRCVRIVHGVGYGSKDKSPVLPLAVRRWLSQLDFVLAFTDCNPAEGGSGAVKVLLRVKRHS